MVSSLVNMEGLVTVVIANYNRCQDLREALSSVMAQDYPRVEVIVVDNASRDASQAMMAREFPQVVVVPLAENIGMDGYSVGFRAARGQYIFQMDNDSLIPDAGVLSAVVQRFEAGPPNLAVVATRVEEYSSGAYIDQLRHRDRRRGPIKTGGFHSGGVGFRRIFLDRVGSYNRAVFLYGSELFLQMKFLAAGYTVMYYPEILMLHKSSPEARSSEGLYYEIRNRYWFLRVFATPWQQFRFFPSMLTHDLAYALFNRAPGVFGRALRDGFGPLPKSLEVPLISHHDDIIIKVAEVGLHFRLSSLWKRIHTHLRARYRST
jgi:GT2 family glycosyltransferase